MSAATIIVLDARTARRLAGLLCRSDGAAAAAEAAAEAAAGVARAHRQSYELVINALVEQAGLAPDGAHVDHDADAGSLTITVQDAIEDSPLQP